MKKVHISRNGDIWAMSVNNELWFERYSLIALTERMATELLQWENIGIEYVVTIDFC